MKRLPFSCKVNRTFANSEHPCRQRRQTVATLHDVDANGWQGGQGVAARKDKDFQTFSDRHQMNDVGASAISDVHIGANGITQDLDKLTETEAAPSAEGVKGRADEYNLQKSGLHASLWQQEIKKHLGESISIDENEGSGTRDSKQVIQEGWESFDPSESHSYDGNPIKEEAMMLEEFEKRRERNRIQIASFVKQHLYGRRRPVDGWKYILNNFGKNDGAGGLASSGEGQRQATGNELEKLALKSEGSRFRRKG